MIQSHDPGIQLYVRNKRPEGMAQFSGEKTLLYVHGTTQAASSTFDLPLDGFAGTGLHRTPRLRCISG